MKTRESGMPDEERWSSFFSPEESLTKLGLTDRCRDVVDFGCGYGTFAIPAARIIQGVVYAIDIDAAMVAETSTKAKAAGLANITALQRDFMADGTGLRDSSADYVMLFNILHAEEPMQLLREAARILSSGGLLGIMHWNYDPTTPRGPSMAIRPRPEQCRAWAEQAGFRLDGTGLIQLPPYHYGMVMNRP